MYKIQLVTIAAFSVLTLTAACDPKVDTGGYVREEDFKDKVKAGQSTREDVRNNLGSPSAQSSFGDESWYYVTSRKEAVAFLRPEVVEQDVTKISFDQAGVVTKVENFNKDNGVEFDVTKRITPTEGHTMGFFEQVLGNLGRFNSPNRDTVAPGRRQQ